MRQINSLGIELIKYFESLSLKAYLCPAGKWTIGWGHTGKEVKEGMVITLEQAELYLKQDLAQFEKDVESLVKVSINGNQFSALVSFAYNVGSDIDADIIPEGLGDSTLLKLVNSGDFKKAAEEFKKWNKATVKGVRKILSGLTKRRLAESKLFLKEISNATGT